MQSGIYSTIYTVFKVNNNNCLGKMIRGRGMRSRPNANSINNLRGEDKQEISQSLFSDTDFPSLSDSISSVGKRRIRVDLGSVPERNPVENVENTCPLQLEASTSLSHQNDKDSPMPTSSGKKHVSSASRSPNRRGLQSGNENSSSLGYDQNNDSRLPTHFGKQRVPYASKSPNLRQSYHERGGTKRNSVSPGINIDEPFDICQPEATKPSGMKKPVNEMNSRKWWVPKVEFAEENEQPEEHSMEENNNLENSVEENGQHEYSMEEKNDSENLVEEIGQVLRPGMVLLKKYIPVSEQVNIVSKCRDLGLGPGGFYRPGYNDGAKLRLYMMCLGLDWNPQTKAYGERRHHDDAAPPNIPQEFTSLVRRILDDSHNLIKKDSSIANVEEVLPRMSPDVCIVNYYSTNGRLGLHQDRDESQESLMKGLPVVSISVGDSAEFLYGDQRDVAKAECVLLESGDVLVFGGESRHVFHGVTSIIPETAPTALLEKVKLRPGRLNLTFRKF